MSKPEPLFKVGDIIDWETKVPWYKANGPFLVVRTFDNNEEVCSCGKQGAHIHGDLCQLLPKQLLVVKALESEWVIIDQRTGAPAVIESRFFKHV